jgi:hypothetical protein
MSLEKKSINIFFIYVNLREFFCNFFSNPERKLMVKRALSNYGPLIKELSTILITTHASAIERKVLRTTTEQMVIYRSLKVHVTGAARMEKMIHMMTSMPGYELSYFQRCCMDVALKITAVIVFKGCSAQDMADYFKKTGRELTRKRLTFWEISRRSGKTDFLTLFAAVAQLNIPNLEQLSWSLYNETAELFCRTMARWIVDLKFQNRMRVSKNHLFIFTDDPADVRKTYVMGSQNPNVSLFFFLLIYLFIYFLTT